MTTLLVFVELQSTGYTGSTGGGRGFEGKRVDKDEDSSPFRSKRGPGVSRPRSGSLQEPEGSCRCSCRGCSSRHGGRRAGHPGTWAWNPADHGQPQ